MCLPKAPAINRVEQTGKQMPVILADHFKALYVKPSDLRARDENGCFTKMIGMGLFASVRIKSKENLGTFKGELISSGEYYSRVNEGRGGYAIKVTGEIFLDCYDTAPNCLIFKANNGKNCHNISLCEIATNNCELKISHGLEWRVKLYTTRDIAANVELCWSYGKDFSIELRPAKCTT